MKFVLDAQLPPALARWLCEAGHEAQPVREIGLRDAEDAAICAHAVRTGAVVLTKDEDFVALAQSGGPAPVVVWLRIGNCSNAGLRAWLEPRWPGIVELVAQGQRVVEVI